MISQIVTVSDQFQFSPAQINAWRLLDKSPCRYQCLLGGARSGKTVLIVMKILERALRAPGSRHLIARFRSNAVWTSIAGDQNATLFVVARRAFKNLTLTPHRQDGYFELPNGSTIWLGGLDDQERLDKILGREYCSMYFNEASEISWSQFSTAEGRLAEVRSEIRQRAYIDLNPIGKMHWANQAFVEGKNPAARGEALANPEAYAYARLNPADNAHNLDPEYLHALQRLPEKQRKRFWEGVFVDEVEGALWSYENIERNRRDLADCAARFNRIVVGVDPSGAWADTDLSADEIGIVVCASDPDGHGYVLADRSIRGGPMAWALAAVKAYREFSADCIVAEINFGGAMVESTIRNVDANVPLRKVTASRGKAIRAEPISALYEQDRVHHCGRFPELEDQYCAFAADGYRGAGSPDRADAAIWALSELFGISVTTGIIDFYRSLVEEDRRAPVGLGIGRMAEEAPGIVRLRAPRGISTAFGMSGQVYQADAEGHITVREKDAGPLERAGFERVCLCKTGSS